MWVLSECLRARSSACCVLSVPDLGKCAVCSPPQAVAQVMIQSFQLSSCALFNAQMQDVSAPPPFFSPAPYLSISGPYLDVCEITWQDSLWCFNTCKHGQRWDLYFSFWVLSSLCLCSGSSFLSSVFFLHQFTNVLHLVCVFYVVFILYYTVCLRLDWIWDTPWCRSSWWILSGSMFVFVSQHRQLAFQGRWVTHIVYKWITGSHLNYLNLYWAA